MYLTRRRRGLALVALFLDRQHATRHLAGRADQAADENAQAAVIEAYLPARLGGAALEAMVKQVLEAIGAGSMADMGRAMKAVNERVAGRADGAEVAAAVKKLLSTG